MNSWKPPKGLSVLVADSCSYLPWYYTWQEGFSSLWRGTYILNTIKLYPEHVHLFDRVDGNHPPRVIRGVLQNLDEFCRGNPELTIVIRTCSPVTKGQIVPLTEKFNRDWLAQFHLGTLYMHGTFGDPGEKRDEGPDPYERSYNQDMGIEDEDEDEE